MMILATQPHELIDGPDMIRNSGFHRTRHAERRLMHAGEIVEHKVKRKDRSSTTVRQAVYPAYRLQNDRSNRRRL